MLGELGLAHDVQEVNVFTGEGRKPEYQKIHPHGYVPALELDDGQVMIESSAICMFLGEKIAPAVGSPERAKYYEWMVYVPATIDPTLETIMFHTIFLPEEHRVPSLVERAKKKWNKTIEPRIAAALEKSTFILGETFTPADVMVASALGWARMANVLGDNPAIQAYMGRIADRPAFVSAHAS